MKIKNKKNKFESLKPTLIFITGASGSGKTSISKKLEQELPNEKMSVNYFDDIGAPSLSQMVTKYGSSHSWQKAMLKKWIEKLSKITDKEFIILEGSFYPEYATLYLKQNYILICIHAEREVREKRLIDERKQPELANQDMENYAQVLKQQTIELGGIVINSSNKNLHSLAQEIIQLLNIPQD